MIIGLFLRHYKIYNNLNFIPITNYKDNKLSLFVGSNGVGKSSILEALNTFFNNGYWNRTKNEKKNQAFICPIFIINKEKINRDISLNDNDRKALEIITEFIINIEESGANKEVKDFLKLRDNLDFNFEENYLLFVGCTLEDRNSIYFGSSFDNEIKPKIIEQLPTYDCNRILTQVRKYFSYIYIPVESRTDDILKLEAYEMQKLMNKDILEEIESILKNKSLALTGTRNNTSVVNVINTTLNNFMESINSQIKLIDSNYSFKVEEGFKKNLTAFDLREHILKAYFSIRTLKKDRKEIFELSSGEQRIALIDIATAFIKNNATKSGEIILAIDEPEASLHISKCFNQFRRLEDLSLLDDTQVLMTTHWYGSIPTLQQGTLNHIEIADKVSISSFSLNNYLENRRSFPEDIDLKSFFELISTILASIKAEKKKWLIVEGSDDRLYFKNYVSSEVDDLIILPVGGCGNVIKIYEYLFAPFSEKVEKGMLSGSKVLCIIDSDNDQKRTNMSNPRIKDSLKICRVQNHEDKSSLENLENLGLYYQTTIEDCLDPQIFFKSLEDVFNECEPEILELFNGYERNTTYNSSRINSHPSLLEPKSLEYFNRKKELLDKASESEFKILLAQRYSERCRAVAHQPPELFQSVIKFFNN